MAKGIFLHRPDSPYDDSWDAYHFPKAYLTRVEQTVGDWAVYMEPAKYGKRGYYAAAKVSGIRRDADREGFFFADLDTATFLEFPDPVPFRGYGDHPEKSILNEEGRVTARARAAVRVIPDEDFYRIVDLGVGQDDELPRVDESASFSTVAEEREPFQIEQERELSLVSRMRRDGAFRRRILKVYDKRCALTGFQWINGGGRAEVQAAHIKPVEEKGPDTARNGLALSGTVHWMFDRGLLGLADSGKILVSNQVNDVEGVRKLLRSNGMARFPEDEAARPHPHFLAWHRNERFKGVAVDL